METKKLIDEAIKKSYDYLEKDKFTHARIISSQIIKIDSNCHDACMILGICCLKDQNIESAKEFFLKCLECETLKESAYNNLSICYSKIKQHHDSINCIWNCLSLNSTKDYYWSHLGMQYKELNYFSKADECFVKALDLNPSAINLSNYGAFLGDTGDYKKAAFYFEKSLKKHPSFFGPYIDLFHVYALNNRYSHKLWEYYEKRFDVYSQLKWVKEKNLKSPKNILECKNKKCVIYCEQGIGDGLMFMRYLKLMPSYVKYVISCEPEMKSIFEKLNIKVIASLKNKKFDFYISLLSLPFLLKKSSIPKPFFPITSKIKKFNNKIGVCWSGSPAHAFDKHRSIYFKKFYEIFKNKNNLEVYSLVKNYSCRKYEESNEIVDLSSGALEEEGLIKINKYMKDVESTAKIILEKKISLVITVDTMIAHLALSMGIETWLLLSKKSDWRWGLKNKSKWYENNLKIFRQTKLDEWDDVLNKIEEYLSEYSSIKKLKIRT